MWIWYTFAVIRLLLKLLPIIFDPRFPVLEILSQIRVQRPQNLKLVHFHSKPNIFSNFENLISNYTHRTKLIDWLILNIRCICREYLRVRYGFEPAVKKFIFWLCEKNEKKKNEKVQPCQTTARHRERSGDESARILINLMFFNVFESSFFFK